MIDEHICECSQKEMLKEIRDDVKVLLAFRSAALALLIGLTTVLSVIGWIVSNALPFLRH